MIFMNIRCVHEKHRIYFYLNMPCSAHACRQDMQRPGVMRDAEEEKKTKEKKQQPHVFFTLSTVVSLAAFTIRSRQWQVRV